MKFIIARKTHFQQTIVTIIIQGIFLLKVL
jgi:hypothetical protein